MDIAYRPYVDPNFESLIERIHPPRVCVDNDTHQDCTLVKVDSANKHGILLEMVQVLTDLDLIIAKSYICSDGGWLMDVFHVTDQLGNKLTDETLVRYIQQALCASKLSGPKDVEISGGREARTKHSTEHTALELTVADRPGILSEVSAVLAEQGCNVTAAVVWTHNTRAACIIYVRDDSSSGPTTDPYRLALIEEQLENVVEAHDGLDERRSVRLTGPALCRTHTERRLHQLMFDDRDYERCCGCDGGGCIGSRCGDIGKLNGWGYDKHRKDCFGTHVSLVNCEEKGYWVVNVRSRDRAKLLFDTVCTLTDMQYAVFHAAVSSNGTMADQEYYIRHNRGGCCTLDTEAERRRVTQCLIAAIERRDSQGLRLDVCATNRLGLLSDVTRVFRENGLSVTRAEIWTQGGRAVGSFYVTDTSGNDVKPETLELVRKEIGGNVSVVRKSPGRRSQGSSSSVSRSNGGSLENRPRFSLGSMLWSQLERLSKNFGPIRS